MRLLLSSSLALRCDAMRCNASGARTVATSVCACCCGDLEQERCDLNQCDRLALNCSAPLYPAFFAGQKTRNSQGYRSFARRNSGSFLLGSFDRAHDRGEEVPTEECAGHAQEGRGWGLAGENAVDEEQEAARQRLQQHAPDRDGRVCRLVEGGGSACALGQVGSSRGGWRAGRSALPANPTVCARRNVATGVKREHVSNERR